MKPGTRSSRGTSLRFPTAQLACSGGAQPGGPGDPAGRRLPDGDVGVERSGESPGIVSGHGNGRAAGGDRRQRHSAARHVDPQDRGSRRRRREGQLVPVEVTEQRGEIDLSTTCPTTTVSAGKEPAAAGGRFGGPPSVQPPRTSAQPSAAAEKSPPQAGRRGPDRLSLAEGECARTATLCRPASVTRLVVMWLPFVRPTW